MSWYSSSYRKRQAIAVDCTGGGGTVDVTVAVSATWDDFWNSILSNGYDIVVTQADGITLCTFERASYSYSSRTLTLEIDNVSLVAGKVCVLWVYYANPDEVTDRSTSVTPSSPKTGTVLLNRPARIEPVRPDRWKSSRPTATLVKKSVETVDLAIGGWELWGRSADTIYNRSLAGDEVLHVDVTSLSGGVTAAVHDEAATSIYEDSGAPVVAIRLTAGSSGTDYTVRVTVTTVGGQVLVWHGWLAVRDTAEA